MSVLFAGSLCSLIFLLVQSGRFTFAARGGAAFFDASLVAAEEEAAPAEVVGARKPLWKAITLRTRRVLGAEPPEASDGVDNKTRKLIGKALKERMTTFPGMKSVKHLLQWNTTVAGPRRGPAPEPLKLRDGPRIVSFHDMAGGYQEKADNEYAMLFRSWDVVDMFVYFSHISIVVPPLSWIALAHEHKRMVLGTIMFENHAEEVQMLEKHRALVIQRLVEVAEHYGFDGWLLNNEAAGWTEGDPVNFVKELKAAMHKKIAHSQVLAYPYSPADKDMFEASDGVFVQYNWDMQQESMRKMKEAAGNRPHDVYLGLDAFGGPGGPRSNEAPDPSHIRAARDHDMSVAIFAPGFTFEVAAQNKYSKKAVAYDRKYWQSIGGNMRAASSNASPQKSAVNLDEWPLKY